MADIAKNTKYESILDQKKLLLSVQIKKEEMQLKREAIQLKKEEIEYKKIKLGYELLMKQNGIDESNQSEQ